MISSRRAVPDDAPALARIAEAAYTPYLARMNGQRPGPMDADYARLVAEAETWVALVDSETDSALAGFLILADEGDRMLLNGVAVDPAHHGQGVGRHLLELAEARTTAAGHHLIRLYTHVTMVENQRLYERNGWVETHQSTEQGFARVFYAKEL